MDLSQMPPRMRQQAERLREEYPDLYMDAIQGLVGWEDILGPSVEQYYTTNNEEGPDFSEYHGWDEILGPPITEFPRRELQPEPDLKQDKRILGQVGGNMAKNGKKAIDPIRIMAFCSAVQECSQLLNRCTLGDTKSCAEVKLLLDRARAGVPEAVYAKRILEKCSKWGNLKRAGVGAGLRSYEVGGFWGDLWDGIKGVSSVIPGVGQMVSTGMNAVEKAADLIGGTNKGDPKATQQVKQMVDNANAGSEQAKQALSLLQQVNDWGKSGKPIPDEMTRNLAKAFMKQGGADLEDVVESVYKEVLGRHSDPVGLANWINASGGLRIQGKSDADIKQWLTDQFKQSDEYKEKKSPLLEPYPEKVTIAKPPIAQGFYRILLPSGRVVDVSGDLNVPSWLPGQRIGHDIGGWLFNKGYRHGGKGTVRDEYVDAIALKVRISQQPRRPLKDVLSKLFK